MLIRSNLIGLSLSMLVLLLLSACHLYAPVNLNEIKTFTFEELPNTGLTTKKQKPVRGILMVKKPSAQPGYAQTAMLYSDRAHQIKPFTQHKWAAPPTDMLWSMLIQALQETGRYQAVLKDQHTDTAVEQVLWIDGLRLKQVFTPDRLSSQIDLMFTVTLAQPSSDKPFNKPLVQSSIHVTVPTATPDPYAGVMAANQAVRLALKHVIRILKTKA